MLPPALNVLLWRDVCVTPQPRRPLLSSPGPTDIRVKLVRCMCPRHVLRYIVTDLMDTDLLYVINNKEQAPA